MGGGSDTAYAVVAVGDFFGNGTDDILFRNNSTGDTWFEAISNGAFNGWHQVGGSNTSYTVKTLAPLRTFKTEPENPGNSRGPPSSVLVHQKPTGAILLPPANSNAWARLVQ